MRKERLRGSSTTRWNRRIPTRFLAYVARALTHWPGTALKRKIPSVFAPSITFISAQSCYDPKARTGSRTSGLAKHVGLFLY